jgi:sulfate permease, SulP family
MATAAEAPARGFHSPLSRLDVAGAFGDIGVLLPIAMALISLNHMNPTAVFGAAGLAYILAGAYFRIPMAVQPFKAVAAIALASSFAPSSIASAGLLIGLLLAVIGATNLVTPLARLFGLPIVRGIQLGLGLILLREGIRLAFQSKALLFGGFALPSWAVAIAGTALLAAFVPSKRFPAALVLLGGGVLLGAFGPHSAVPQGGTGWGPMRLELLSPSLAELKKVLVMLALPQFALTFGNSIVATENTAQVLYGPEARRVTARALSLSIGLMNVTSSLFLGAPTCHGSGGITAHYKFGARTPKSSYVIGGVCLLLAFFGRAAVGLLHFIPTAVLAVFLGYVGVQHGALVRDIVSKKKQLLVAAAVGVVSFVATNLTLGFLVGFLVEGLFRLFRASDPANAGRAVEKNRETTNRGEARP